MLMNVCIGFRINQYYIYILKSSREKKLDGFELSVLKLHMYYSVYISICWMYAPFSAILSLEGAMGIISSQIPKTTQVVLDVNDEDIFLYSFFLLLKN